MYTFRHIQPTMELWERIESSEDATCFHTKAWYKHLQNTYHYKPFLVEISSEDIVGGCFVAFVNLVDISMHHQWEQVHIHRGLLLLEQ